MNPQMWKAPDIVPSITYADLPKAVEWLERVFGFRERAEARLSWPGGGMTWMEVGNALLNLSTPNETWPRLSGAVASGFVQDPGPAPWHPGSVRRGPPEGEPPPVDHRTEQE